MDACRFDPPLLIEVQSRDGRRVERIADAAGGLAALHQGLGGFGIDRPEWYAVQEKLVRAKLDPCPERSEAARQALCALARDCQALVEG